MEEVARALVSRIEARYSAALAEAAERVDARLALPG
jgi:hypothetical protein